MVDEDKKQVSLRDVQSKFIIMLDTMLDNANENGEVLDPKVLTEMFRFMSSTRIEDTEPPSSVPEIEEARKKAEKLLRDRKSRNNEDF